MESEPVVVAILAKDKAHCLPFYLDCIYNQTYPKKCIQLYIRTNDNTDNTATILANFIQNHKDEYKSVWYDDSSISDILKQWKQHEWTKERFRILGKLRQESVEYAKQQGAHYFVADCDNFITPKTLETMYENRFFGVVSPMLRSTTLYSNFSYEITPNGYHVSGNTTYLQLYKRQLQDIINVQVVHCTYFIYKYTLHNVCYDDDSERHEYVIFCDAMRKKNIPQYLDNRNEYGFLTFAETKEQFQQELQDIWLNFVNANFSIKDKQTIL